MDLNMTNIGQFIGLAFAVVIIWGIPLAFIVGDPRISKKERIIWIFAVVFVSWFAWLLYFFVAPVLPRENHHE